MIAATVPFGFDEVIDEGSLFGRGRAETVVVFGGERIVVFTPFVADDFGLGVEAGFE